MIRLTAIASILLLSSLACAEGAGTQPTGPDKSVYADLPEVPAGFERAIFAGGCFWCMEKDFEHVAGVLSVTSGYIGGKVDRPTYSQVSARTTGHAEAVLVVFDPKLTSYEKLLDHFWRNIDPTVDDRQFCDVGDEYRPEIFPLNPEQKKQAEASKERITANKPFKAPIKVKVSAAFPEGGLDTTFFTAERYHQDFYKTNPGRYGSYRSGCGRDARLKELWGSK